MVIYNDSELQHYGVLGMKWGKRKDNHKFVVKNAYNYSNDDWTKNKKIKNAATLLNKRSKKVNDAYSVYYKALTNKKSNSRKEIDIASKKHGKEAYKLRKDASKMAKKLLGRYGKKPLNDLYVVDYVSGKLKRHQTSRNILANVLANMSLEDTATKKQNKEYQKLLRYSEPEEKKK